MLLATAFAAAAARMDGWLDGLTDSRSTRTLLLLLLCYLYTWTMEACNMLSIQPPWRGPWSDDRRCIIVQWPARCFAYRQA